MINRCSLEQEETGKSGKYKTNPNFYRVTKTSSVSPHRFVAYPADGQAIFDGPAMGISLEDGLTANTPGIIQILGVGPVELGEQILAAAIGTGVASDSNGKAVTASLDSNVLGFLWKPEK